MLSKGDLENSSSNICDRLMIHAVSIWFEYFSSTDKLFHWLDHRLCARKCIEKKVRSVFKPSVHFFRSSLAAGRAVLVPTFTQCSAFLNDGRTVHIIKQDSAHSYFSVRSVQDNARDTIDANRCLADLLLHDNLKHDQTSLLKPF